jgi:hypothetical protein
LADQVKIVARDEPPPETTEAEKASKAEEKKAEDVCLLLSGLPIAEIVRLESLLSEKLPDFKAVRTAIESAASYWVFIPPAATKRETDNKAAELKKLRIAEFFVVQEDGPNNRAISLGLFSGPEAADAYLGTLRSKGVKSARVAERNVKPVSASLEISGPEAHAGLLRQAVAEVFPGSKPAVCKTRAPTGQ